MKLRAQLMCGDEAAMGPGTAMVLAAIDSNGSISAAGRELGMSYRRIWLLVDRMNRCWSEPLVETSNARTKGAQLTESGQVVLKSYQAMVGRMERAAQEGDFAELIGGLRSEPRPATAPSHPQRKKLPTPQD